MNRSTPVLLCAGEINLSGLPVGTNKSNSMLTVNGKPVIGWILDDLHTKGYTEFIIVSKLNDTKLTEYLNWAYSGKFRIFFAYVQPNGNILHSLLAGLTLINLQKGVLLILGDTLVTDSFRAISDCAYAGTYDLPENWCLVKPDNNGYIESIYEKQEIENTGNLFALSGVYQFSQSDTLKKIVIEQIQNHKNELSSVIEEYRKIIPIEVLPADNWYDFGHLSGFNLARKKLLQSRYFNSLEIDSVLGTITKRSRKPKKLIDEINWYLNIPAELNVLIPKIVRYNLSLDKAELVQELYGYPNLAELLVFGDLDFSVWKNILKSVFEVHLKFKMHECVLTKNQLEEVYLKKTFNRLEELKADETWNELLNKKTIEINGVALKNIPLLDLDLRNEIHHLLEINTGCLIHGDYCLSNILYDLNSQIVRLIDPKGSFGEAGIYGDPRYDIAKLSHSIHGSYDFIMSNQFKLEVKHGAFEFAVVENDNRKKLNHYFESYIAEIGYSLKEIRLIESLLFLSMIPLHNDHKNRQLAMYLTGIIQINNLLYHENSN